MQEKYKKYNISKSNAVKQKFNVNIPSPIKYYNKREYIDSLLETLINLHLEK